MYQGADVKNILVQLSYIIELGEEQKIFFKKGDIK